MLKVVIIDDEAVSKRGIRRILENMRDRYTVVGEASNGLEGLQLIQQQRPHVVITDIRMPQMNGLEMIQAIHETDEDIKTVIVSGYDSFEFAQQALRMGVVDYILKPVHINEFILLLDRLYRNLKKKKNDQPDLQRPRSVIQQAVEYIQQNYNKPLTLTQIAEKVNLTDSYFSKLFKEETGINYQDYLLQCRMERAKGYLRNTNLKVYEISQLVGYEDAKYFYAVFKRFAGCTPNAYREGSSGS